MLLTLGRGLSPNANSFFGFPSLQTVSPSCVFDVDATVAASFANGQIFANLIGTPADGAAKTAYDFTLGTGVGVSTDDPSFIGAPSLRNAYFLLDGGDCFKLAGSNTAFLSDIPKNLSATTLAVAFTYRDSPSTQILYATNSTTGAVGIRASISGAGDYIQFVQRGDTAQVVTPAAALPTLVDGKAYVYVAAYDPALGVLRQWLNAASAESALTFNPTTTDTNRLTLGAASGTASFFLQTNSAIRGFYGFKTAFDNAAAARLLAALNFRHGGIYA